MPGSPTPAAPQHVAPLLALATQFLRAGRPADAIAPLRDAALLQPSNAIIQHDLGLACLEVGRIPDAVAAFQRAVASDPRYGDAYFRLGIALEKLGDMAGPSCVRPRHSVAPIADRGVVPRRRPGLHAGPCRRGDRLFPPRGGDRRQTSFGRLGKARALLTADRNQEAEQVLRRTVARIRETPSRMICWAICSRSSAVLTRPANASNARSRSRRCWQDAITIWSGAAGSPSDDDGLLERMEAALGTPGLEASQRVRLHLAHGQSSG